jgi:crotonobetainyl-CoA:carnitine CoA-transferase CaiB-like acyl-CoA transferase
MAPVPALGEHTEAIRAEFGTAARHGARTDDPS